MYKFIIIGLFIILYSFTAVSANDDVVFVSSYNKSLEVKRGMFHVLIKDFKLDFKKHIFYLNSKGKTAESIKQQSLPILEKIKEIHPRIVFLSDDNALKFLGPTLVQQGIKIVALGINANPRKYFNSKDFLNVYGVLERPLFIRGIIEINNLVGHKDNAIILFDDSATGEIIIKKIFNDREMIKISNTNIKYIIVKNLNDMQKKLEGIDKDNSHLFLGPIHSIKVSAQSAELASFHQVLNYLTRNYKSDYYGFWKDYIIPDGANVSYGVDLVEHADLALKMGYQILNNTSPKSRFVTPDKGKFFRLEE